jgi:hypothetical protein
VPAIDDVAWLSTTRVAVLMAVGLRGRLAARGPLDLVAFFQASRLLAAVSGGDDRLLRLRTASLAGELVVAWPDRLLTRSGAEVRLPDDLRGAVALALSPDERWLAVATGFELALVELPSLLARGEPLTVRLPLAARDVDWR